MKKKKTKQLILDKSLDIFAENSFFSISMQDIADEIEIKKSLIYYYFDSKSKLYQEAISQYIEKLINQFEIVFSTGLTATEKINELSDIYLDELTKERSILLNNVENNKLDKSIIKLINNAQRKIVNYFESIISEGIQKGEFKKIDPKKSSLTMVGYLEKTKQYDIKLEKNWFDFLLK